MEIPRDELFVFVFRSAIACCVIFGPILLMVQ